ncbi:30S ribosomal protein S16 [Patescibacteria group bacterium]
MVKIRLARHGRKNDPFYRIVAIQSTKKRDGEPLDVLGHWYPKNNDIKIDKKKLNAWVDDGAQITAAVKKLINV